jgi:hypothetical protein
MLLFNIASYPLAGDRKEGGGVKHRAAFPIPSVVHNALAPLTTRLSHLIIPVACNPLSYDAVFTLEPGPRQ